VVHLPVPVNRRSLLWLGVAALAIWLGLGETLAQEAQRVWVVDLLVVYTPAARAGAGGTAGIQSQIQGGLLEANLVLQNSRVNARLRLVHMAEITYDESGSVSTDLARLRDPKDGFMDEVHALRDQRAADLVCLVMERGDDWWFYGLQGPSAPNAFSVIRRPYLTGGYYLPVVLSFNFGCQLERPYADSVGAFPYSYGYSFTAESQLYSTVEGFSGERLPWFSNPDVRYGGVPCGVPPGLPGAADNADVLNLTAPIVAGFRGDAVSTVPPLVALVEPPNGSECLDSTNLTVLASASDGDGRVTMVEFFVDNERRAVVASAPFLWVWKLPPTGEHVMIAVATDDQGAVTRSQAVNIRVDPAPPSNDNFANRVVVSGSNTLVPCPLNPLKYNRPV
jgi:hypothetical protein